MAVEPSAEGRGLGAKVRRALAWSLLNNLLIRIGNFAVGILVARIVAPEEFGVFAVALTVQAILIALAELGLSAELVRNGRIKERAGTATAVALGVSGAVTLLMVATAGWVSEAMGAPQATPVLQVMALTLVLSGLSVVPYARLQRDFRQAAMLATDGTSLVVGLVVTVVLVSLGFGAMALAISRVIAQTCVCVMQYWLTRMRPAIAFDRVVAIQMVSFGAPIAAANVLSWLVMNAGHVAVGRMSGALMLGFYLLAFNISSWPMSALGQAIRAVALPGFSQIGRGQARERTLAAAVGLTWAVALLIGVLLSALATVVIPLVYGDRWLPAAAALAGLAFFGAQRIVFDLLATYLIAAGATRAVFVMQVVWLAALAPVLAVAVSRWGIAGAGWAQVGVGVVVLTPGYLVVLHRLGIPLRPLGRNLLVPLAGVAPAGLAGWYLGGVLATPILGLIVGGLGATIAYVLVLGSWLRRRLADMRAADEAEATAPALVPEGRP